MRHQVHDCSLKYLCVLGHYLPPHGTNPPTMLSLLHQETELRSRVLEEQLAGAEQRLEENQEEQENFRKSLRTLLELLDGKIFELTELRDTLARLIEEAS